MAEIYEDKYVITISKLVKTIDKDTKPFLNDEEKEAVETILDETVRSMVEIPGIVIELTRMN